MKKLKNVKLWQPSAWVLILFYFVLAVASMMLIRSYTKIDLSKLFLTPKLIDNLGWDIYCYDEHGERVSLTPAETLGRAGNVYLSRVLDTAYEETGYTTLNTSGPVSIFLDGALLYTTSPGSGNSPEETVLPEGYKFWESLRITLPPGYGGKTLTMVFNLGERIHGTPTVLLSNINIESAVVAATANAIMIPASAYMTVSFLLLGLLFYGGFQGRWDWSMLLLTLAAFFQSLYHLRDFSLKVATGTALDIKAAVLIPNLFATLPLCYLLCRMRERRKLRAALVLLPALVSMVPWFIYLFSLPGSVTLELVCSNIFYISVAVTLVCAVSEARLGNRIFRLFLAGLGTFLGTLTVACLFSPVLARYVRMVLVEMVEGSISLPLYWIGTVLFVLCAVLSAGNAIQNSSESRTRAEFLNIQVSALESRVRAIQTAEESIRIERHDLRHRLQIVADMVRHDEKAQVLDYLGAAQTHLEELKPVRRCQNPVLDAVFSSCFKQAERQNIKVEANLAIPNELPVNAAELSTVFANALENAINACAALPENERKIVCNCRNHPGLMFEVANTYAGEVRFDADGFPVSSRRGHGIGTRSIAAFCEKHSATCSYEAKDGWFRMRVIL